MPARTKRGISADDLYRLQLISDCQISPDSRHVVFGVQRVDMESEKKYANLWVVPTDRGPARQEFAPGIRPQAERGRDAQDLREAGAAGGPKASN